MPIDVITKYSEERIKVRVSKDVLEVIISIAPECYRVYIDSRELCIQLTSKSKLLKRPVTPNMILQRRKLFKDKIRENSVSTSGNYVGIRIEKFEKDLTCLINSTGTWLQKINGYLRKKPCDINSICKTLKQN